MNGLGGRACKFQRHVAQSKLHIAINIVHILLIVKVNRFFLCLGTKIFCVRLICMSECKFVLGYICTFARAHIKENLPRHISGSRLLCFGRGAGRGHGSLPDVELRLDELAVVGAKYAKFAQIAICVTS